MHIYKVFGGTLASDIDIPELTRADASTPTWTLRSTAGPVPDIEAEPLGSDIVTGDVRVQLYRRADGFRLVFDDTGCFDITGNGSRIDWTHEPAVTMADARADLLSRVIATALYAAGTLCLHGSAVVLTGSDGTSLSQSIGFMAPKLHGKSTLALAMVGSGGKLLTDDTLPVAGGRPPIARPGLHATRLWPDSAARVGIGAAMTPATDGAKQLFTGLPAECVTHEEHPLAALYLLAPTREPRDGACAWRTRLSPMESAMALIGHAKLAPLLTGTEAASLFRRAGELAGEVAVYRLNVVRDLDRLDEVVATIRSWHLTPADVRT